MEKIQLLEILISGLWKDHLVFGDLYKYNNVVLFLHNFIYNVDSKQLYYYKNFTVLRIKLNKEMYIVFVEQSTHTHSFTAYSPVIDTICKL